MQNGILTLSWTNIKSALVYGIVMAFLSMALYIIGVGSIFEIDFHALLNLAFLAFLGSIVKNLMTTDKGNFLGLTKVIPSTPEKE